MDTERQPGELDHPWTSWWAISAAILAGVVTVCMAVLLEWYDGHSSGSHRPIETKMVVGWAVPSGLFLIAILTSLRSGKIQRAAAISAVLFGVLYVCATLLAISTGLGHGTGLGGEIFVLGIWIFGMGMSVVILVFAAATTAWRSNRKELSPPADA